MNWMSSLVDTAGFVPRKQCGDWSDTLIVIHIAADIMIWLAYLSLPLILISALRHPFFRLYRKHILLFAAFILSCGFTHFVEAFMFESPLYRLSGFMKVLTAVISWVTVLVFIPALPTLLAQLPRQSSLDDFEHKPRFRWWEMYIIAVLVAMLTITIRFFLDPYFESLHPYSICLIGVTFVAWYGGYKPGLLTLFVNGTLATYLFVQPRYKLDLVNYDQLIGFGLFFACGICVSILGESQRNTRWRLVQKLSELTQARDSLVTQNQKTEEGLNVIDGFVRHTPHGIAYFDAQLRYLRVNETFARVNGLPVEAHIGRTLTEVLPDFPEDLLADYRRVLETGESLNNRLVVSADASWELTAFAVPMADGSRGLGVVGMDITERLKSQEQLREAASLTLQLTEGVPMLMWACEPSGKCIYLSKQWVEFTGVPAEPQLGHEWVNTLHPDDRGYSYLAWQTAVKNSTMYDVEYRIRRHDGVYRWFSVRGIPVHTSDGAISRWYGSCADIDERKRQAESLERLVVERTATLNQSNLVLREQRIFMDAILENVSEGIVACDEYGHLKLFNKATRQMHGLNEAEVPPEKWAEHYQLYQVDGSLMPPDQVPLRRAWRGEVVVDAEMFIRSKEHTDRYVLCSGRRLSDEHGKHFGAVISMRDMTERRDYEQRLLSTTEALKASNEELEKFAYIASHDLQEPLRKIQAFGARLSDKYKPELGEQGKDYIDRMLASAGRMRNLIDDLLSFSRISTKKNLPAVVIDFNEMVRDVLSDLDVRIQATNAEITVGTLPTLACDTGHIRQVFQNLINNALKFTKPEVTPKIRIDAQRLEKLNGDMCVPPRAHENGWRITVTDNGIGFEQEYADRIFELFQRLHSKSSYEGTGLGLAIVRKILLRYGASISAQSQLGIGTTFTIDWPTKAT